MCIRDRNDTYRTSLNSRQSFFSNKPNGLSLLYTVSHDLRSYKFLGCVKYFSLVEIAWNLCLGSVLLTAGNSWYCYDTTTLAAATELLHLPLNRKDPKYFFIINSSSEQLCYPIVSFMSDGVCFGLGWTLHITLQ